MAIKLNLGCGPLLKSGYINVDMLDIKAPNYIKWDLTKGLPNLSGEISEVISCHVLEHFSPHDGHRLLKNLYNKMIPGAVIRTAVPNFGSLAKAYVEKDWSFFNILPLNQLAPNKEIIEIAEYAVYQYVNNMNEHKSLWDIPIGIKRHINAGFKEVEAVPYDTTVEPNTELRSRYTIVFRGVK